MAFKEKNPKPESDTKLGADLELEIDTKKVRGQLINKLLNATELASRKIRYCRPKRDRISWLKLLAFNAQIIDGLLKGLNEEAIKRKLENLENAI